MSHFASFQLKGKKKPAKASAFDSEEEGEAGEQAAVLQAAELQEQGNQAAASGQWSVALRKWDEALSQGPANAHLLHEQKAQVYLEVGEAWRAIQSATAATQLRPGWVDGHLTLARAQLNYGEPELALQSMNTVLQLAPENAEAAEEINTVRMLVLQRKAGAAGGGGGGGGAGAGAPRRVQVTTGSAAWEAEQQGAAGEAMQE